jgi:circadian clock protein KaiC
MSVFGEDPNLTRMDAPPRPQNIDEKVLTHVPGLDKLMGGGFERNATICLFGGPGTGKTTLALQILHNAAVTDGEPGLYISFEQSRDEVYRFMKRMGYDLEALEKKGLFTFKNYYPTHLQNFIKEDRGPIEKTIETIGSTLLGIDSLTALAMVCENEMERRRTFLKLFETVKIHNTTSIFTVEEHLTPDNIKSAYGTEFLADGVVNLYNLRREWTRRLGLEIIKMRGVAFPRKIVPYTIESNGINVFPDLNL